MLGTRVRGRAHNCEGEVVAVHSSTVVDIRWDFGARWNWQQEGKDFEIINVEVTNERKSLD